MTDQKNTWQRPGGTMHESQHIVPNDGRRPSSSRELKLLAQRIEARTALGIGQSQDMPLAQQEDLVRKLDRIQAQLTAMNSKLGR